MIFYALFGVLFSVVSTGRTPCFVSYMVGLVVMGSYLSRFCQIQYYSEANFQNPTSC